MWLHLIQRVTSFGDDANRFLCNWKPHRHLEQQLYLKQADTFGEVALIKRHQHCA
jgi:hypothetical protein